MNGADTPAPGANAVPRYSRHFVAFKLKVTHDCSLFVLDNCTYSQKERMIDSTERNNKQAIQSIPLDGDGTSCLSFSAGPSRRSPGPPSSDAGLFRPHPADALPSTYLCIDPPPAPTRRRPCHPRARPMASARVVIGSQR
jgi:hypothetical protein